MPTIRYVDPVNGPYLTIQAAHDAAGPWDTLLVKPGTYAESVTLTKPVHIKADTEDPVASPCTINGPGGGICVWVKVPWDTDGDLFIEGMTLVTGGNAGWPSAHIGSGNSSSNGGLPPGLRLWLNRCLLGGNAPRPTMYLNAGGSIPWRLRMTHCTYVTAWYDGFMVACHDSNEVELIGLKSVQVPYFFNSGSVACDHSGWSIYLDDHVLTPTVDYGAGYGDFYGPQFLGTVYELPGVTLLPEGMDRSETDIRLYREADNGRIEPFPWMQTHPDPVSGEWLFRYLPTDQRYWVATLPPQGYQPYWDGPYIPQAA